MKTKKLRHAAALLLPLMAALPAAAEALHYNIVNFHESVSVRVPNDTLNVTFNITETSKNRQDATQTVTRRLNALTARLKAAHGIESEIINRNVYPEYDDKRRITGWRDSAQISASSTDFAALSRLIADSENEAMIQRLYYSVSPKKRAAAVEEAGEKVLKTFRDRAAAISRSLGFGGSYKIVKLELNESFQNHTESRYAAPMPMAASLRSAKMAEAMDSNPGEQEIQQSVNVSIQMQ